MQIQEFQTIHIATVKDDAAENRGEPTLSVFSTLQRTAVRLCRSATGDRAEYTTSEATAHKIEDVWYVPVQEIEYLRKMQSKSLI